MSPWVWQPRLASRSGSTANGPSIHFARPSDSRSRGRRESSSASNSSAFRADSAVAGHALSDAARCVASTSAPTAGLAERIRVDAGRTRERDRLEVVVREHLGVVLGRSRRERLDPLRGEAVLLDARRRAGSGRTRRRGRARAGTRTASRPRRRSARSRRTNSLRSSACSGSVEPCTRGSRARRARRPEHLADHRRVLQQRLLARAAARRGARRSSPAPSRAAAARRVVEPPAARARARGSRGPGASARTPPRRAGCRRRGAAAPPASRPAAASARAARPSSCAVSSLRERRERDRRRVALAAAPAGPPLEQLRPRRADDEQRHAGRPVDEVVDEVEQAVVGPVQILEDEHERALLGERLEEAAPGGERLVAAVAAELARAALRPTSGRRCCSTQSRSASSAMSVGDASRASFSRPSPSASVSRIPACAFTISPSAQ